jgi:hypothetical protein
VEQLTTLGLRADATVQEYMTSLKVGYHGSLTDMIYGRCIPALGPDLLTPADAI